MATEKITYYNMPDVIYDGNVDVVKGTSLTGKEVDKNFNTLEGRDIKDVNVSDDGKSIVITRMNGERIQCENLFEDVIQTIDFEYQPEDGVLFVYINNDRDKTIAVEGFLTEKKVEAMVDDINVFTDSTLEGNGTISNPLKIAKLTKTGVYRPINGLEMPDDESGLNVGDRYIEDTEINVNGSLYNYDGVMHIIRYLEYTESPWHVARKADWDDMLDALEPERQDRTHCSKRTPDWLGEFAGAYLVKDDYGFNVNYCGYALEEGKDEPHLVCEGTREIWWTATNDNGRSAYVKRVEPYNGGVYQDIIDSDQFYSVRLVRDIEPSDNMSVENIMGEDYQVVAMPSMKNGQRLWINVNFRSELMDITESKEIHRRCKNKCTGEITDKTETEVTVIEYGYDEYNRYTPEEWKGNLDEVMYVCEWNGTNWIKSIISNYDAFLCIEDERFYYVKDGKLKSVQCCDDDCKGLEGRVENLEVENIKNCADIEELNNEVEKLSSECEAKSSIIDDLIVRIEKLEEYYRKDMVEKIVDKSISYEYADRPYSGSFERDGETVLYTPGTADTTQVLYDFARFIGAHYWSCGIESVVYGGETYKWSPELNLKGSNYSVDGTLDTTLVKQIKTDFESGIITTGMKYAVNGTEVEIKLKQ